MITKIIKIKILKKAYSAAISPPVYSVLSSFRYSLAPTVWAKLRPPVDSDVTFKAAKAAAKMLFRDFSTIEPVHTDGTQTPSLGSPKNKP